MASIWANPKGVPKHLKNADNKTILNSIKKLSKGLLTHSLIAKKSIHPSRQKNILPASKINLLTWDMFKKCQHNQIEIPDELLELLACQLKLISKQKVAVKEELYNKRLIAALFRFLNPTSSSRQTANYVSVDNKTILKWGMNNLNKIGGNINKIYPPELSNEEKLSALKLRLHARTMRNK